MIALPVLVAALASVIGQVTEHARAVRQHPDAWQEASAAARPAGELRQEARRSGKPRAMAAASSLERAAGELAEAARSGTRQAEVRARAVDVEASARSLGAILSAEDERK